MQPPAAPIEPPAAPSRSPAAALCLVLATGAMGCDASPPTDDGDVRPNLLIVTLDTVRADHMSCYGYFRETSPRMDALAEESLLFEFCLAPISNTLPSHASLFTGTYPHEHGILRNFPLPGAQGKALPLVSTPGLRTIAEHLTERGYRTGGFVSAAPVKRETGLAAGFATWDEPQDRQRAGFDTVDAALDWLRAPAEAPFFCWVHLFDAHQPYAHLTDEHRALFQSDQELLRVLRERSAELVVEHRAREVEVPPVVDLYDGGVRYCDDAVGRLLDLLVDRGLDERTIVVLVGDHGEGLGQHGALDHGNLWLEQLRVPLIVHAPGVAPRRVATPLSLVDVLPTVFSLVEEFQVDAFLAQSHGVDALAGVERPLFKMRPHGDTHGLVQDGWSYVRSKNGAEAIYHLESDPHELVNLYNRAPDRVERLREALDAFEGELARRGAVHAAARAEAGTDDVALSEELLEELQALGYGGGD